MDDLRERLGRRLCAGDDAVAVCRRAPGGDFVETTYAQLAAQARRLAASLAGDGGGIVPLLVGRSAASIAAMLAVLDTGRAFSFVNPRYRGPQIERILDACRSPLAVIDGQGLLALGRAAAEMPAVGNVRWILLGDELGPLHERPLEQLRRVAPVQTVAADAGGDAPERPASPGADPADAAACLFTSGSTGTPKGVLVGRDDLARRVEAESAAFGIGRADVLLGLLPFSFDVGLNQMMTALAAGAELVLLDSWLPADILAAAARRRVTGISSVPAIWQDLIAAGRGFDTGGAHASLRYLTVSGGSLSAPHLRRLRELAPGVGLFKTYGQSEAFRATLLRPEELDAHFDSVGRPFADARVYVVRDDGSRCRPGEVGEVVHTGLGTMLGYLGESGAAEPEAKLRPNPFAGEEDPNPLAVFTGDLGFLDGDGYLHLRGRRDGMLKVRGNRVYPAEVAAQIHALPGVRDAVVVARPSDADASLVAFVVAGAPDLTAAALRRELGQRLPAYMVPAEIHLVDRIPLTETAKPDPARLLREHPLAARRGIDQTEA